MLHMTPLRIGPRKTDGKVHLLGTCANRCAAAVGSAVCGRRAFKVEQTVAMERSAMSAKSSVGCITPKAELAPFENQTPDRRTL